MNKLFSVATSLVLFLGFATHFGKPRRAKKQRVPKGKKGLSPT